ncbi:MAG: DUF2911 domain-containing protein [Longimicrobiales bacterium]
MRCSMILVAGALLLGARGSTAAQASLSTHCVPQRASGLAERESPYDSLKINIGSQQAMLCYGRPSAKGAHMIGGPVVAFGKLWRMGANEPTILHIAFPSMIAGIHVEPGSYSIYSVPGPAEWEIIINRSITQWGSENRYTDAIKAQEVGRGKVRSETIGTHVETMLFRAEPAGARGADLILEWEKTRVRIPIRMM